MKTFIKTLTTGDTLKEFGEVNISQMTPAEQATHLVRQCWGIKYLKLIYGNDLWFLFTVYADELASDLKMFIQRFRFFKGDVYTEQLIQEAISICQNALEDPVHSVPLGITEETLSKFFFYSERKDNNPMPNVPIFGSVSFATTLFLHCKNMAMPISMRTFKNESFKGAILIPYNPLNPISAWKEIKGAPYNYPGSNIEKTALGCGIEESYISSFLQLLICIDKTPYLQAPESVLGLLGTFMIDPYYINDYVGYVTAMSGVADTGVSAPQAETNAIIYKGCYRVLYDELDNSVFSLMNRQCKVVVTGKNSGFTKPLVDNLSAKNLVWLLCYITQNSYVGFTNNEIITKLIKYFEPRILPADIPVLLTSLHKVPDLTMAQQKVLLDSGFGPLFSSASPFSVEADENVSGSEETGEDKEEATSTEEEKTEDPIGDIDSGGLDPDAIEEGGSGDSGDSGDSDQGEGESSDGQSVLPEYLLELGAPPDLDNVLYRMEFDRTITALLHKPPKYMSAQTLKRLKKIQSYWLHIVSLPILKLVMHSLIKKG